MSIAVDVPDILKRIIARKQEEIAERQARVSIDDLAAQDPRPLNPMAQSNKRINIYNPSTDMISPEPLKDIFRYIPARVVQFRVFALDHRHHAELARAAERVFDPAVSESCLTNI